MSTDKNIAQLTSYTSPISTDLIPIWDITNSITKSIAYGALNKAFVTISRNNTGDYNCDGVADDVQFQSAIDDVNAAGGGEIFIKSGTYNFSTYVILRSNIIITGAGESTNIVISNSALSAFNNRNPQSGQNILATISNVKIRNFKINGSAITDSNQPVIGLYNAQNIEVSGMDINAQGFCIFIGNFSIARGGTQDTKRVWVHHNLLKGICTQDIIGGGQNFTSPDWDFRDIIVESNYISHNRSGSSGTDTNALDIVSAKNLIIRNNIADGNIQFGNEKDPHTRSIIEGNIVRTPLNSTERVVLMVLDDQQGTTQSGLTIINNNNIQAGQIIVGGTTGLHVKGMVITNNIITQDSTINSATILNLTSDSIKLSYTDRALVSNNYIDGGACTSTSGILISNGINNLVSSNYIYNHPTGIKESNTTSGNVFNNNYFNTITTPFTIVADAVAINNKGANPQKLYAQGNITGSTTFDRTNGDVITATLTGNITTTFASGSVVGDRLTLILNQGSGSHTVSKPSNAVLVGGAFSPSAGASAVDMWTFIWDGTNWNEQSRSLNLS